MGERTMPSESDGMSTIRRRADAIRPQRRLCSVAPVAPDPPSITIRADELRTVREAMRDFSSLLAELEDGEVEKLVLTQRNRMRAVVVSIERWSELERARAGADAAPTDGRPRISERAESHAAGSG
jgi:antitoxin (DNA-binding transcriptional repressor) of toxin-antitoxin stability system